MRRLIYLTIILLITTTLNANNLSDSDVLKKFSILEEAGQLLRSKTFIKDNKGWYHFYKPESNYILLSIKPEGQSTLPNHIEVSCGLLSDYGNKGHEYNSSFLKENTAFFTMNRYWRINAPSSNTSSTFKIRFYFSGQDLKDISDSFQALNIESPDISELTFYSFEGSNTHPFSKSNTTDELHYKLYENPGTRGVVISERFNYVEFKVNKLNSSGSGGLKKDLRDLQFWLKGKIATKTPEHLDKLKIRNTQIDNSGYSFFSNGTFSIPLTGGSRDINFGFSFEEPNLSYLNIHDLIRLKDHLSGKKPLNDPMLLYAADLDNNGFVDKYDYDYLLKLIKGERQGFSANNAFTVINDKEWQELTEEKKQFTPNKNFTIDQVVSDIQQDFILIVKGDLDQEKQSTKPSKSNILSLSKSQTCGLGEITTMELYGSLESDISGLQFSLSWNPTEIKLLEIKDSVGKNKTEEYFNVDQINEGLLGFVCIDHKKLQVKNGKLLLAKLIFKVDAQNPNSVVSFTDYPSNIHVLNKDMENISIHLEDGLIVKDSERSINIEEIEIKQPSCNHPENGSIRINAGSEIYSDMVIWNDGFVGLSRKNLPEGIYSYEIRAKGKCTLKSDPIEFKVPEKPSVTLKNLKPLNCLDGSDASIEISVEGGQEPYYYYWSNDARTPRIDQLSAGNYYVEVIDNNNCKVNSSFEIESNGYLGLEYFIKPPSSNSEADGIIEITNVHGINVDKSGWIWKSGNKGQRIEKLSPNYYTVEFSGPEGCNYQKTFNLKPGKPSFQTKAYLYSKDIEEGFKLARLSISSPITSNLTINIFNKSSEVIWSNSLTVQSGVNMYYIPIPELAGDYLLQIPKVLSQRFIVE